MKYPGSSHDSELSELEGIERELRLRKRVRPPYQLSFLGLGIALAGVLVFFVIAR
jgi:hypothetical protein